MKLRDKVRARTIKNQMTKLGIITILLLVASNIIVFSIIEINHNKQESFRNLNTSTTIQKMYIESWFERQSIDVAYIAQTANKLDNEALTKVLESTVERSPDFTNIHYINVQGDVIASAVDESATVGTNVSSCEYFQVAINEDQYFSDVTINNEANEPRIYFSSPVKNTYGEVEGIILAVVKLETIEEIVDFFILNKNADIYLVNKEGYMITSPKYNNQFAKDNDSVEGYNLGAKIDTEIINKAFKNEESNSIYRNYNGELVLGDYKWVVNDRWIIVAEFPLKNTLITLKDHFEVTVSLSVIIIIIFIIISYRLSKNFTLPIKRLRKSVQSINSGNYDHYIDEKSFEDSPEEIKDLCAGFNQMTHTINDNILMVQKNRDRLTKIVETIPSGLVIYDSKGNITLVNKKADEVLGIKRDHINNFDQLASIWKFLNLNGEILTDDELPYLMVMKSKSSFFNYQLAVSKPIGSNIIISVNATPLFDDANNISNVLITINDITEQKELEFKLKTANEILESLSYLDALTGIANRRRFDEVLDSEWKRANRSMLPLSIILIDIDNFKAFNDHYGHKEGDVCLKEVAMSIKDTLKRPADLVARYGGEEFVVILPETNNEGAVTIAEQIRINVEQLKILHQYSVTSPYVTISLGTATIFAKDNINKYDVVELADKALYKAKKAGRNRVAIAE